MGGYHSFLTLGAVFFLLSGHLTKAAPSCEGILYLSGKDIRTLGLTLEEVIPMMREMFLRKARGEIWMVPKPILHPTPIDEESSSYRTALMAADGELTTLKDSMGVSQNPSRGKPYNQMHTSLRDANTGELLAFMDALYLTGLRTAAVTAVATEVFANPGPVRVGLIGAGFQARMNLEAITKVRGITHVSVYDLNRETAKTFSREVKAKYDVEVEIAEHPRDAVANRDLVITAGAIERVPDRLPGSWISEGCLVVTLDFDSAFSGSGFDLVLTDDIKQIDQKREEGLFADTPKIRDELATFLAGERPSRIRRSEKILFHNLGIATSDLVITSEAYRRAKEMKLGRWLER